MDTQCRRLKLDVCFYTVVFTLYKGTKTERIRDHYLQNIILPRFATIDMCKYGCLLRGWLITVRSHVVAPGRSFSCFGPADKLKLMF